MIVGNPNPNQYYTNLHVVPQQQVPVNQEASSSTSSPYIDPSTLSKESTLNSPSPYPKVEVQDKGCGEYHMNKSYCISKLTTPKSYGKPTIDHMKPMVTIHLPPSTTFTKWG